MIRVYKDDVLIPNADIISISEPATEKLQFNFQNLISATLSVDINNVDITKYDDEIVGSMFYGSWYNANLKCIDDETNVTIWNGRIKNIRKNDAKATLTIESNNYIKEIVDTVCEVSMGNLSNATPSEIIYTLITGVCGIPVSAININSFDTAKSIQIANSGYIIATYTKEANVNCGSVINEILRITSSYLYTVNNILYYSQFKLYTGDLNALIDENQIIASSYTAEYSADNIFNDYSIVYYSSSSLVAYAVPESTPTFIAESKIKYGTKKFLVPSDEVKETTPASYKILLKSLTSARYYGDLIRSSSHYAKKIINLTVKDSIVDLNLNSMFDVNYKHLKREPIRIIERKVNQNKHSVNIKAEMVNFPYAVIDRDKTPPIPIALIDVTYGIGNSVELYWTRSNDSGLKQYIIEFSTSITDFEKEYSDEGYSPLPVENPIMKDGLCTYKLSGLKEDAIYYFRIRVADSSLNISEPSNVISLQFQSLTAPSILPQLYHCAGDLINGLSFQDGVGVAPSGFITYDFVNYDTALYSYAGIYTSGFYTCYGGFKKVTFITNQPAEYYVVQVSEYKDGVSSAWTNLNSYTAGTVYTFEADFTDLPTIIQFRVLFAPLNYSNTYSIQLNTVN